MAYTQYVEHLTIGGERLDTLAYKYYGDPFGYKPIVDVNVDVVGVPILPQGMAIRIPVLPSNEIQTLDPVDSLPPWRDPE